MKMTEEQRVAALDIIASMMSYDCSGIDCEDCPLHYGELSCMVTVAATHWRELNKMKGEN